MLLGLLGMGGIRVSSTLKRDFSLRVTSGLVSYLARAKELVLQEGARKILVCLKSSRSSI